MENVRVASLALYASLSLGSVLTCMMHVSNLMKPFHQIRIVKSQHAFVGWRKYKRLSVKNSVERCQKAQQGTSLRYLGSAARVLHHAKRHTTREEK